MSNEFGSDHFGAIPEQSIHNNDDYLATPQVGEDTTAHDLATGPFFGANHSPCYHCSGTGVSGGAACWYCSGTGVQAK